MIEESVIVQVDTAPPSSGTFEDGGLVSETQTTSPVTPYKTSDTNETKYVVRWGKTVLILMFRLGMYLQNLPCKLWTRRSSLYTEYNLLDHQAFVLEEEVHNFPSPHKALARGMLVTVDLAVITALQVITVPRVVPVVAIRAALALVIRAILVMRVKRVPTRKTMRMGPNDLTGGGNPITNVRGKLVDVIVFALPHILLEHFHSPLFFYHLFVSSRILPRLHWEDKNVCNTHNSTYSPESTLSLL